MNRIYLISILILIIIINYTSAEKFDSVKISLEELQEETPLENPNIIQYNIKTYNDLYFKNSDSIQTVPPYFLTKNNMSSSVFYIDRNDNLIDSGNNYVRFYSNNLVKNYGNYVKVKQINSNINNDYYLYYVDENNIKIYISVINKVLIDDDNIINMFTSSTNINNQSVFKFIEINIEISK